MLNADIKADSRDANIWFVSLCETSRFRWCMNLAQRVHFGFCHGLGRSDRFQPWWFRFYATEKSGMITRYRYWLLRSQFTSSLQFTVPDRCMFVFWIQIDSFWLECRFLTEIGGFRTQKHAAILQKPSRHPTMFRTGSKPLLWRLRFCADRVFVLGFFVCLLSGITPNRVIDHLNPHFRHRA